MDINNVGDDIWNTRMLVVKISKKEKCRRSVLITVPPAHPSNNPLT